MCALKRPYDKPSDRTTLESLAVAQVISAFEGGLVELVSSSVTELENSMNPQAERREEVADLLQRIPIVARTGPELLRRGREIEALGLRSLDALHLASAESTGCNYFVSCDDQLLASAGRAAGRLNVPGARPPVHGEGSRERGWAMRTTMELLADGWKALVKELGLADALRYKVLFQPGAGEYAKERRELFGHRTMEDWERDLREWEKAQKTAT